MQLDVRKLETAHAAEIYITAVPRPEQPLQRQAEEVFGRIRDILVAEKAHLFEERIFAAQGAMKTLDGVRRAAYGSLDDGVAPTHLIGAQWPKGEVAGVLVHAVRGRVRPEVIRVGRTACGRVIRGDGRSTVALSGLMAAGAGGKPAQARAMLNKALAGLKEVGCDFLSVARTWMWLGDILSWYGEFNHERNEFFSENGLLSRTEQPRFPASTGIGVKPAGRAGCAMDLVAVGGAPESITRLLKGGDQNSAFNYGSAFSRAATAVMPAGKTVFVSGTAAVACDGSTQHVGNAPAQIEATVAHFRAILGQTGCSDGDVVQAIVYCKSDEVARAFRAAFCHLPYPQILVICDICRDDLLFEIEGTACPGAKTV